MTATDALLTEFDHEMKTTRSLLERVPLENGPWKPHTKSRGIGALATHIANLPGLGFKIASESELDASSRIGQPEYATMDTLLAAFDENVAAARAAIATLDDAGYATTWKFTHGGHVIVSGPRSVMLRSMLMNHMIHHRGQLSVYLRLNDVPLPSIYGPTADT
jgi:uncharacterized damage-inducible protein DinB